MAKAKKQPPVPTHEEAVERGKKGGQKNAENIRKRKTLKEAVELILSLPPSGNTKSYMDHIGIDDEEQSNILALAVAMFNKSLKGDVKAAEFLRDSIGEKPDLNVNSNMNVSANETKIRITLPDNARDDNE